MENSNMLPVVQEENVVEPDIFPTHVNVDSLQAVPESPSSKKQTLKTFDEINTLLQAGKKKEVKIILRENAWPCNHAIRTKLWPALCYQHAQGRNMMDGFYWEMAGQILGTVVVPPEPPDVAFVLPGFVDRNRCLTYNLTRRGRYIADRLITVLGAGCPDITCSPTLYPIASLLLHFMSEEQCYNCLASLISSKSKKFVTQTNFNFEVTWKTLEQIARRHVKSAVLHLARHCSGSRAEKIFADWIWWIFEHLPFQHLVRIMDCFLHEGLKVLYRVAMAIILLFYKHSSSPSSVWMNEISTNGVDAALSKFCNQIPLTPSKFLRTAFGIRGFSTSYMTSVYGKLELSLQSQKTANTMRNALIKSRSSDNLPTSQSQANIQMMSHTLTIREQECEDLYKDRGSHSPEPRTVSQGVYLINNLSSSVVPKQIDLFTLWSWLPVRITMYQPILLYTTEEHGCSLTTFYIRVEQHEPTLLMIKTCNNEVFGAYCSTRWCERNMKNDKGQRQAYFGTGETFLFSLYPERAKYPWVGVESSHNDSIEHSSELFMAADAKMITIGGGEGQAIWLDENIRYGKTDRCTTFNNPPLCASCDFEIRVLEVYGFAGA